MIVLIANEKGGVGKTTIAVNLAAMCRRAGHDVLLVDTDRQESAGTWAAMRHEDDFKPTVTCVSKTGKVGRDLVELAQKYPIVVVDAGGRDSLEMRQALAVCDFCVIPIKPAQFDVWSLSRMGALLRDLWDRMDRRVNAFAVVNGASPNPAVRETGEVREALADYSALFPVMATVITERIAFRRASRDGLGVVELPTSHSDAKATAEMSSLYEEVFGYDYRPK